MRLAVIPARGGSKRIPRKNIKEFCGKPMIAWSILAALESNCFDRVLVSTDDGEIAKVAREWGAETPFIRPKDLSGDHVPTAPVVAHAIRTLGTVHEVASKVCCVYATAPFLTAKDIRAGMEALESVDADFAFSVSTFAFPIQRALKLTDDGRVAMFAPEHFATRSQDLEHAWHDAGQFYWGTAAAWLDEKPIFSDRSVPVALPRWRVQDIDTPEDWTMAELLFAAQMTYGELNPVGRSDL